MEQMKVLRFTLSGKQAFFKKPEENKYYYFTYGHIHRVALLGLLGTVMGYSGYAHIVQKKKMEAPEYPEFYEQLKELKMAVIPCCEKGSFPQKIIAFNNSVGYASMEKGGNLIVRQQWLENPKWYVYIMLDSEVAEAVADSIIAPTGSRPGGTPRWDYRIGLTTGNNYRLISCYRVAKFSLLLFLTELRC